MTPTSTILGRFKSALMVLVLMGVSFSAIALVQNSNEKSYKKTLEQSEVRETEILEVIRAGVEGFKPSKSEYYWPGCNFYRYTPTAYEAGFCDGTTLAHSPYMVGASYREIKGIVARYFELVVSKNASEEICKSSTDIKQWYSAGDVPIYGPENKNIDIKNRKNESAYISGCKLGILKSFDIGILEEESRMKTVSRFIEKSPRPVTSEKGSDLSGDSDIDKTSNVYVTMFTVGKNFAKVSFPEETAQSQCNSALANGLISSQGAPRYLGEQARLIQSYLKTPEGWQGCIDGFGS